MFRKGLSRQKRGCTRMAEPWLPMSRGKCVLFTDDPG